jgi:hypothetical protein
MVVSCKPALIRRLELKMRALVFVLVLLAAAASASSAAEWRVIAGDHSYATSDCLGSNQTAECLADTFLACEAWITSFEYTESGFSEEDPICASPGLDPAMMGAYGQPVHPFLIDMFYYLDSWRLEAKDLYDYSPLPNSQWAWHVGDTVMDLQVLRCMPRKDCLQQYAPGTALAELRLRCPRVDCSGSPHDSRPGVVAPALTLILRLENGAWRHVGAYPDGLPRGAEPWVPDHWKRK